MLSGLQGLQGHCCKGTCGGEVRGSEASLADCPSAALALLRTLGTSPLLPKKQQQHLPDRATARRPHRTHVSSSFPTFPPKCERSYFSLMSTH